MQQRNFMYIIIASCAVVVLMLPLAFFAYRMHIPIYMTGYKMLFSHGLLLLGLLMVIWAVHSFRFMGQERSWPVTEGRIISACITGVRAPHPVVKYSYRVGDTEYQGVSDMNAPGFGTKSARRQTARVIVKQIKPGAGVQVHYKPDKPGESVILVHPKWNNYLQYGVGIIFIALALAFVIAAIFQRRLLKKQLDI